MNIQHQITSTTGKYSISEMLDIIPLDVITGVSWDFPPNGKMSLCVGGQVIKTVESTEWFFPEIKEFLIGPLKYSYVNIHVEGKKPWPILTIHGKKFDVTPKNANGWAQLCPEYQVHNNGLYVNFQTLHGQNQYIIRNGIGTTKFAQPKAL